MRAAWRELTNPKQENNEGVRAYGEALRCLAVEAVKSCENDIIIYHFQANVKQPTAYQLKLMMFSLEGKDHIFFDHMLDLAESIERTQQDDQEYAFYGRGSTRQKDTCLDKEQPYEDVVHPS